MLQIHIPGAKRLAIEHLVLDFNGTLACDGRLLRGVATPLRRLAKHLAIHVLSADTFGTAKSALGGLPCKIAILGGRNQARKKALFVRALGASCTACIGNGCNDRLMMRCAALSIVVIQSEGAARATLSGADLVTMSIRDALGLLTHPQRLAATLRP